MYYFNVLLCPYAAKQLFMRKPQMSAYFTKKKKEKDDFFSRVFL